ncbi:hypothetical protein S83_009333 [Arachis hypogaea]
MYAGPLQLTKKMRRMKSHGDLQCMVSEATVYSSCDCCSRANSCPAFDQLPLPPCVPGGSHPWESRTGLAMILFVVPTRSLPLLPQIMVVVAHSPKLQLKATSTLALIHSPGGGFQLVAFLFLTMLVFVTVYSSLVAALNSFSIAMALLIRISY